METEWIYPKRDPDLIGLFPGSRLREVRKIFPLLLEAANLLKRRKPSLRFEVGASSPELASETQKMIDSKSPDRQMIQDRKSTRLNSSHVSISYAVFCLKKK